MKDGRCHLCGLAAPSLNCNYCTPYFKRARSQKTMQRRSLVYRGRILGLRRAKPNRAGPVLPNVAHLSWQELINLYHDATGHYHNWHRYACRYAALAEMVNRLPADGDHFWQRHPSGSLWKHLAKLVGVPPNNVIATFIGPRRLLARLGWVMRERSVALLRATQGNPDI